MPPSEIKEVIKVASLINMIVKDIFIYCTFIGGKFASESFSWRQRLPSCSLFAELPFDLWLSGVELDISLTWHFCNASWTQLVSNTHLLNTGKPYPLLPDFFYESGITVCFFLIMIECHLHHSSNVRSLSSCLRGKIVEGKWKKCLDFSEFFV